MSDVSQCAIQNKWTNAVYKNHLEWKKMTETGTKTCNALYGAYKSSQQHSKEEKTTGVNKVYWVIPLGNASISANTTTKQAGRSYQNASNNGKARNGTAEQDTTSLGQSKTVRKLMIVVIERIALPCCHNWSSHAYPLHSSPLLTSSYCAVQRCTALPYTPLLFCTIHDMSIESSQLPYHCKIRHSYISQLLRDSSSACITVSQQCGYIWRAPHNITVIAE
jgi:hypothetical protein